MEFHSFVNELAEPSLSSNTELLETVFDSSSPKSFPARWSSDLTHRSRVLLYTKPLLDLRVWENLCDESLQHYDALALAMKLFDAIIETMGIDREIDSDTAIQILTPLMMAMDRAQQIEPDPQRHALMVERLLGKLLNDSDRRNPFRIEYTEFDGDRLGKAHAVPDGRLPPTRTIRRVLEFRLIYEANDLEGRIVLRLSDEAINLFLNALKLEIEDAQAAAEAVVQSQLARGRYGEAVNSARDAKLQSIRFQDLVDRKLRDTRRDLRRVDWQDEMPRLLTTAREHIETRRVVEINIINAARAKAEHLAPGSEEARQVAQIEKSIEDCYVRHVQLLGRLIPARSIFLDEQLRQSFTPDLPTHLPNLPTDVLEPILQASRFEAESILNSAFPAFFGARAPRVFSLATAIESQLQPRREIQPSAVLLEPRGSLIEGRDRLCYPPEVRERAQSYLDSIQNPTHLSEILTTAIDANESTEVIEAIALIVYHLFAPDGKEQLMLQIEKIEDKEFTIAHLYGDDLLLSRRS
jgi:hypothetical protein